MMACATKRANHSKKHASTAMAFFAKSMRWNGAWIVLFIQYVRRQVCHASVLNEEHDSSTHACAKIVSAAVEPISRQGVRRAYALMIPTYELRTYHFQADLTAARTSALALRLTIIICMREDACSMDMKFIATIQSQSWLAPWLRSFSQKFIRAVETSCAGARHFYILAQFFFILSIYRRELAEVIINQPCIFFQHSYLQ